MRHRTMLKSHQLDKKPIDVHAVIDETLGLVEHNMSMRQVEASISPSSSPCVIDGDPVLLQQAFMNLIVNAVDAMADTPPAPRRVTIGSDVRASDVDVSVRDTGPGLPAHMLGAPFMLFVTTKAHRLGIGLTIVQTIVAAHGGHRRRSQPSRRWRDTYESLLMKYFARGLPAYFLPITRAKSSTELRGR